VHLPHNVGHDTEIDSRMFLGELFDHLPTMFLPDRKQVVDVEFSQSIARWSARTTKP
jgi:hypothetical protein